MNFDKAYNNDNDRKILKAFDELVETKATTTPIRTMGDIIILNSNRFEELCIALAPKQTYHVCAKGSFYSPSTPTDKINYVCKIFNITKNELRRTRTKTYYQYVLARKDWQAFKDFMKSKNNANIPDLQHIIDTITKTRQPQQPITATKSQTDKLLEEVDEAIRATTIELGDAVEDSSSSDSDSDSESTSTKKKVSKAGCYFIQASGELGTTKYKIGKSNDLYQRIKKAADYRNCKIILVCEVDEDKYSQCEKELIRLFTLKFKQVKEDDEGNFGDEWFNINDKQLAKGLFWTICNKYCTD